MKPRFQVAFGFERRLPEKQQMVGPNTRPFVLRRHRKLKGYLKTASAVFR
ncbi:hypothetical protein EIKCOROL_02343 [Eikenella corrodens ATCC 23834]|uniref:Uncharacterized protein n=1 Tax=Eikenella corrodens ATCC 23834 TaxID=546274 RepID=C0DY81_EIKCO|nr:hypothetical protein EIKCOROL_02343 [Eikenella corrodens ATCC 23834]